MRACLEVFQAHALELTIERLDAFAIQTPVILVGPGVRLHVLLANRDPVHAVQRLPLFVVSGVVGFVGKDARVLR